MNPMRGGILLLPFALLASIVLAPTVAWAQFTPATLSQAYGLNLLGANYTGAGQTIAIIDAFNAVGGAGQSNLYSDVNAFDSAYGLPALTQGSSLTVMNESGSTTALPKYNAQWAEETTLDVEYAHAIAPGANIEVIEANNAKSFNLYAAASYAAGSGASVVSMSFTITPEDSSSDPTFAAGTPFAGQTGVTFVASAGDDGAAVSTPASNPYVVAVGGTSLTVSSNGSYAGESAWTFSGGGVSSYEQRPTYQAGVPSDPQNPGYRTAPDVAFDADPNTGVEIYFNGGTLEVGGTSVGAPSWAGLFALADQQRAAEGLPVLSSLTALEAMYATYGTSAYSQAFHDIVGGSNGAYTATTGYDEVTGLGSPIANYLVPYLGSYPAVPEPGSVAMVFVGWSMVMRRRRTVR